MKIAFIFSASRAGSTGAYLERACTALGLSWDHWDLAEAARLPEGYALYLRIDHGDGYEVRLPRHARPSAFYAIDTHLAHSWRKIRRTAGWYDLVFCCHRDGAERLAGAAWIPVGCDAELHGRRPLPARWDIACVGTEGGVPRKFYLQALRERYPNSFIGHAPHSQLGTIYSQAKIGFNYSIRDDVNMRMFEILCSGTLLVTNRLSHDDLARLGLREREHFVSYRNPQELFELIDHYLRQDRERDAMALAGMAHAQRSHTYRHRLEQILALAEERLGVRWRSLRPSPMEVPTCAS